MIERRKTTQQDVVNWTGAVIGVSLVGIMAFITWALVYVPMPEANENVMTVLIGILSTAVITIVNFYFGSSSTQKKQQDTIDTLAKTAQTAGTALASTAKPEALVIPEGTSATAVAGPDGTVITTDVPKP